MLTKIGDIARNLKFDTKRYKRSKNAKIISAWRKKYFETPTPRSPPNHPCHGGSWLKSD